MGVPEKNIEYSNVYDLSDRSSYDRWRAWKLDQASTGESRRTIPVADLAAPSLDEKSHIINHCRVFNFAIYQSEPVKSLPEIANLRSNLISFCRHFGLETAESHRSRGDDGIVALETVRAGGRLGYIPYTDKQLSWHTDGYYNAPDGRIGAMVLHCVHQAKAGGGNELFDPEIAYIRLRDENPDYIASFTHPEAMIIPENTDPRSPYRPVSIGPVFFNDPVTGALHMRYSARSRNIIWRDDPVTARARPFLNDVLASDPLIIRHRLKPGQGIISNNILHNRSRFKESRTTQKRLLYRIRYKERVTAAQIKTSKS